MNRNNPTTCAQALTAVKPTPAERAALRWLPASASRVYLTLLKGAARSIPTVARAGKMTYETAQQGLQVLHDIGLTAESNAPVRRYDHA